MGNWYWIGVAAGLGAALGIVCAGVLAGTRIGLVAAALAGAAAGLLVGLAIGEWDEAIAGAVGGTLGAGGAGQVVEGTLRRGGTRGGTVVWLAIGGLLTAAIAFVPALGYVEAAAAPIVGARLRKRAPKKYAGLRSLAR